HAQHMGARDSQPTCLGVVDEIDDVELEFEGVVARGSHVIDDWCVIHLSRPYVPRTRYICDGDAAMAGQGAGRLLAWRLSQPHHEEARELGARGPIGQPYVVSRVVLLVTR